VRLRLDALFCGVGGTAVGRVVDTHCETERKEEDSRISCCVVNLNLGIEENGWIS